MTHSKILCVVVRPRLCPDFVCFLPRMCVLPGPILYTPSGEQKRRYLAYVTKDKVVFVPAVNMSVFVFVLHLVYAERKALFA